MNADLARRRAAVLKVTMVGVAAVSFPNSLITSALPEIARDFDARNSLIAWVSIAPAIAFSISMPMFGKLGDLYGHRRVFISGFAMSTILSLITAAAPNVGSLIVLRTAAQLCGTSTIPSSFAMLALLYAPDERPKIFGCLSAVLAVSPVMAIVFGGPVVQAIGWRWVFVFQSIPCAATVLIARPLLPETPTRRDVRFDVPGAVCLALALSGLLLAINRLDEWGTTHPVVIAAALTGALGLVALISVERRVAQPLLPLPLFRRRAFLAPIATMGLTQSGFVGSAPLTAFLMGQRFGYKTMGVALVSALRPGAFAVASAVADRCAARVGGRVVQFAGNATTVSSGLLGAFGVWHHSLPLVLLSVAASGFGVGLARPGVVTAVNNAVDAADVGLANGVNNMFGQIGSSVGTTILLAWIGSSTAAGGYAHAFPTTSVLGLLALSCGQLIEHRKSDRKLARR